MTTSRKRIRTWEASGVWIWWFSIVGAPGTYVIWTVHYNYVSLSYITSTLEAGRMKSRKIKDDLRSESL